jgi:hypothetical protein
MGYGRWLEEFTVGEVIRHWPGRTITEADCTWFALLTMNQHPIHSDAHYAATQTQHGERVVLGPLVFSIGIGMTVPTSRARPSPTWKSSGSRTRRRPSSATRSTRSRPCSPRASRDGATAERSPWRRA